MPRASPRSEREHAHVRALAADHDDLGLGDRARPEVDELRRVDRDAARLAGDLLPGARELVEVPALVPDRRVHRRDLVDLAGEALELRADRIRGRGRWHRRRARPSLGVARVAALAEPDHAVVGLRLGVEVVDEARGAPDADRQQPGRGRIERPGMADPALAEDPAHLADGVERRDPCGFVEREHPSPCARPPTRAGARHRARGDAGHRARSISRRATSSTLRAGIREAPPRTPRPRRCGDRHRRTACRRRSRRMARACAR